MNIQRPFSEQHCWLGPDSGDFKIFERVMQRSTCAADVPLAADIQKNIPFYEGAYISKAAGDAAMRQDVLNEWTRILANGAGIFAVKHGMKALSIVDRATEVFEVLIEREKDAGGGDHFAEAGANDRVWNALEKHCLHDPENFAAYYACHPINIASEAWLGRGYQVTSQVNRVNPGGAAQTPHRDYHLGFMTVEEATRYPSHVHALSAYLTLQGAVAHCDMPIESGPTQLLPFSQHFHEGYLAYGREEFQNYFARNFVQLALEKGDLIFFNPAVMHAAGKNVTTDVFRIANLLQISSAFGRSMETVNRHRISLALYPVLLKEKEQDALSETELANAVFACAEGYSFPTNLDLDPPIGGFAPKTQAQFMIEALEQGLSVGEFTAALDTLASRRQS
ncbi:MAG: phytanoyl-CoA dioxygenase family protein [Hyphomicrobiales bacterium]|nr:phytanoyl-CoA dioxygenase family protein [Hyphomicrobiales bacterium]